MKKKKPKNKKIVKKAKKTAKKKPVKKAKAVKKEKPSKKAKSPVKAKHDKSHEVKQTAKKGHEKAGEKAAEKPKLKTKPGEWVTVFLALGSNVGDREEYIEQAITLLRETPGIKVMSRASNFETEPEGKRPQAAFINSAVKISTNLMPDKLLETTQSIEDTLGRERGVEWGPRTIDIDILMYASEVISDDKLTVPHPLMHERLFVLEPLKEIAPYNTHPVLERTITELYEDRKTEVSEKYDEELSGFREVKRGIADDYERW